MHLNETESTDGIRSPDATQKPFKCEECGRRFAKQNYKTNHHRIIHSSYKPFECELCGKTFALFNYLKTHQLVHTGEKPFKCDFCPKRFAYRSVMVRHTRSFHTGERPFKCEMCNRSFVVKQDQIRHLRLCHNASEKHLKCTKCPKMFKLMKNLNEHIIIHKSESKNNHVCNACRRQFISWAALNLHTKSISECDKCLERFCSINTMRRHSCNQCGVKREAKEEEGDISVPIIGSTEFHKSNKKRRYNGGSTEVSQQFKNEDDERTGNTDKQDAGFYQIGDRIVKRLKIWNQDSEQFGQNDLEHDFHVVPIYEHAEYQQVVTDDGSTFKGKKPRQSRQIYSCEKCPKSFPSKTRLDIHKNVHLGLKPYKCLVCPMYFHSKDYSRNHYLRIHVKPHKCQMCNKAFGILYNLNKHSKIHILQQKVLAIMNSVTNTSSDIAFKPEAAHLPEDNEQAINTKST